MLTNNRISSKAAINLSLSLCLGFVCFISSCSVGAADSAFVNFEKAAEIDKLNVDMEKCFQTGQYEQALSLAQSVLELCEKNYGKKHDQYTKALNNLAWHEQNAGDFNAARNHFEEALSIMEAKLGSENPKLVPILNNLSMLLAAQGDPERSCPLLERSLLLEEKVLGKDSPLLVNTLNNLAVVYDAAGLHKESVEILERAYQIQESDSEQSDQQEKALTLSNLAMVHQADGDLAKAESFLEQSLALRRKNPGTKDADLSELLNNLAMVETQQNKPEQAREHLGKAIAAVEKALSPEHIDLVPILNNLAALDLSEGKVGDGRKHCLRAARILDRHIDNVLQALSFAEQRSFLGARLPAQISLLISSSNPASEDSKQAGSLRSQTLNSQTLDSQNLSPSMTGPEIIETYNYLYRWKGLLIDSLRRQTQLNALSKDAAHAQEIKKLISLRSRFTDLFHLSGKMDFDGWKRQSDDVMKQKEALERKLATSLNRGSVKDLLQTINLKQFCQLLRADESLIDIYFYERREKGKNSGSYAAFLLDASGDIRLIQLGSAQALNSSCQNWLKRSKAKLSNQAEWDELKKKLAVLNIPDGKKCFVCPDGDLNQIPFSLFFDKSLISHLDAARELACLRLSVDSVSAEPIFLGVGAVEFGKQIQGVQFPELPGTLKEVEELAKLAKANGMKVEILTGKEATKTRVLKQMQGAQMVHLATHGFFSESGIATKDAAIRQDNLGARTIRQIDRRNPLSLSGIILASDSEGKDGQNQILSAEELISTDLHACRSIVLSACDTARGEKENSQGVLGLRAAIMAAGARTLLISLWKVPDDATVALMEEFYKNILQKKEPAAEALSHATKTVSAKEAFKNSSCWGAWVLLGEGW